ncbi:MAG TPA: hypothetical protein VGF03_20370 [Bryobacteraceae bacterium]|jgi:hypothetical protein
MLKTSTISPSVSPTAASESAPSRATQNASTTPKVDSIAISSMVGMASSAMPRLRLPSVKSRSLPASASRRKLRWREKVLFSVACMGKPSRSTAPH